ncbi:hypothetical protein MMC14_000405 [Varicellaria rhodocarpa]|nr:hypothetical protein [Varicellaria rhodocarpa]
MKLFALGSNGSGQLGLGHKLDTSVAKPCDIGKDKYETAEIPIRITAGGNHTLVLLSSGKILRSGSHYGNAASDTSVIWSTVIASKYFDSTSTTEASATFKFCSATWSASVFITIGDHVYTQGLGTRGELGHGSTVTQIDEISDSLDLSCQLPSDTTIVDLASGVHHSVLVLSSGDAYGWGNGRKGQIGEPAEIVWQPRKIADLQFKVVRVICGREFTCLVGDPETGEHMILGADKWMIRSEAPESIHHWMDIGASWGSIFVLDQDGKIVSWGRNDHGQLAPQNLPLIKQIAIGSEHAIALTRKGSVVAWGWGEHGNCGPDKDEHGDVKASWNELVLQASEIQSLVLGVGAGCATSWIWTK